MTEGTILTQQETKDALFGDHEHLAREFTGMIFNAVMSPILEDRQRQIEALRKLKSGHDDKEFTKELSAKQRSLKKALSEEVQQKMFDTMVKLFMEVLTQEELYKEIETERRAMKIRGLGPRMDAIFKEALGED